MTTSGRPYYQHAGVTIFHGDCREILPGLALPPVSFLVTDPPYGIEHDSSWDSSWRGSHIMGDDSLALRDHVLAWWGERPAIMFGTWKRPTPAGTHTVLVWDKGEASGMGDLTIPWKPSWESIYVMGRGFVGKRNGAVLQKNQITWETMGRSHPNEKPVGLLRELLAKCPRDALILDPFSGSGSTLRAAKDEGHRAIGIEIEERYCEIAARRLAQETLFSTGSPNGR